ncbi:MAG: DUF87 domain-containing protein [Chloroflexi bacterium]|nr:DUF87 domain-containing protein [Chloroflexota bacterium]
MSFSNFYLGRIVDPQTGVTGAEPLEYDPADLTTHAVVVGMTGSGKTGLCIGLLEEAALQGIPALMIDPKGDIVNALLHFPSLAAQDFLPWVNADQARREGKSAEQAASEAAARWQKGLAEWDIPVERLRELQERVEFCVYTPGSDAGQPISILASFSRPNLDWESHREVLREKIAATVTALLGLVGMSEIDPVRSREHILLANIFEHAWKQGQDLDLSQVILQTQSPPFARLGVFEVDKFFPEKDRFELAMLLNNILASPAFQSWVEGQPLDIDSLLFTPQGKPRHCVFYIAHLEESERMFFVTLLHSAVETWMRAQTGAGGLRALLYFDEIFGYVPPVANPPSKTLILRMLKQARAFGVGLVLVTQNPADLDYKGLSNAGTWFIGKLQTEQDKQRLLDGLQSAAGAGMERGEYDRLISSLGKRIFLLHNVHSPHPLLFQTRWAMNFLAGPVTRAQIPAANRLAQNASAAAEQAAPAAMATAMPSVQPLAAPIAAAPAAAAARASTRQPLPSTVRQVFLPVNLSFTEAFSAAGRAYPQEAFSQGVVYRPALIAQAAARFLNHRYNLRHEIRLAALAFDPDSRGLLRWEEFAAPPFDLAMLESDPYPQASFDAPGAPLTDAKAMLSLQKDYLEWAYRAASVNVRANEALKLYAGPQITAAEFRAQCADAARQGRDAEVRKLEAKTQTRLNALEEKLAREKRELAADERQLSHRKSEETTAHLETFAGLVGLGRKRSLSSSLSRRRMTAQAKAEIEESEQTIETLEKQLAALEAEKAAALEEINHRWGESANQVSEITVAAQRKDVVVELFGAAWSPYYVVKSGEEEYQLAAFGLTEKT